MVYVLLAEGFETIEALTPVDFLRRAGIDTVTVVVSDSAVVTNGENQVTVETAFSSQNIEMYGDYYSQAMKINDKSITVLPIFTDEKTTPIDEDIDMVVLPGGMPGTKNLEMSPFVGELLDYCIRNDKYIAAICAAPSILGKKGLLKGKKATCYAGYEKFLEGATVVNDKVITDGKIITSRSAGTSADFALELVKILGGEEKYNKLCQSLLL